MIRSEQMQELRSKHNMLQEIIRRWKQESPESAGSLHPNQGMYDRVTAEHRQDMHVFPVEAGTAKQFRKIF